jgi:4-hydroxy 2-oxovalerate aldolase
MLQVVDSSLRDGMHSVSHEFTPHEVARVGAALDAAGVRWVEVSHGDGLGGSSIQYGRAAAEDAAYLDAAHAALERAALVVLLLPGIGTVADLEEARIRGASLARIATHCTEADISAEHMRWAKRNGMRVAGFLMMAHTVSGTKLAEQAALMESYGAEVVYIVDSAGALLPAGVRERVERLVATLACAVGFHGHDNLGCGVGNSLAAAEAGATWLDGSLRGLGAGAGNAATEVLCAALDRAGFDTGVDLVALVDAAEDVVAPLMRRPPVKDRAALALGYAGVYSSFLLHAERAAAKYGVGEWDVLVELGRRGVVGGQEDMIIEVAAGLAARRERAPA